MVAAVAGKITAPEFAVGIAGSFQVHSELGSMIENFFSLVINSS
jgi:hypothetical protein